MADTYEELHAGVWKVITQSKDKGASPEELKKIYENWRPEAAGHNHPDFVADNESIRKSLGLPPEK